MKVLLINEQEINNSSNLLGDTPLSLAIKMDFAEGIKSLVAHGAVMDGLLPEAVYNHETSALETMLELGCNITDVNDSLFIATSIHHEKAMMILLDHGADSSAKYGSSGKSAFELIEERIATAKELHFEQERIEDLMRLNDILKNHILDNAKSSCISDANLFFSIIYWVSI